MSILSITFHTTSAEIMNWNFFVNQEFSEMIDHLIEVEKYVLSEVQSEMISEGKNTNLLLFFENKQKREEFLCFEFLSFIEIIEKKFGDQVMIFDTKLDEIKSKL